MGIQVERDELASPSEEIAGLARQYLEDPHRDGMGEIDRHIVQAVSESRWPKARKPMTNARRSPSATKQGAQSANLGFDRNNQETNKL